MPISDAELDALLLKGKKSAPTDAELDALLAKGPKVSQEQHPLFKGVGGFAKRAQLKNLANDKQAIVATLKKENPELDVQLINDQVVLKSPGDAQFKVLDPDTFELEDISDVGFDVLSGIGETAAGVFGAGVGGPLGAIGASGAAGAGADALRQGLAKATGVEQDFDPTSVGLAGAFGAAGPLLFGSGAKAAKAAAQAGKVGSKASAEILESGLAPRLARQSIAKTGELLSGFKSDLFENVAQNPKKFKAMMEEGIETTVGNEFGNLFSKIDDQLSADSKNIGKVLNDSDALVDIRSSINVAGDIIQDINTKETITAAEANFRDALKEQIKDVFTLQNKVGQKFAPADEVPASVAQSIKLGLADAINFATDQKNPKVKNYSKRIQGALKKVQSDLKIRIEKAVPEAAGANQQFQDTLKERDFIIEHFSKNKSSEGVSTFSSKAFNNARAIGNDRKTDVRKKLVSIDKKFGTDTIGVSDDIASFGLAKTTALLPKSIEGATSTSRTGLGITLGALGGSAIGDSIQARLVGGAIGAGLLGNARVFRGATKGAVKFGEFSSKTAPLRNISQELLRRDLQNKE